MDIQWVKIKSWHAARPKDHADSSYCGQVLDGSMQISDELPAGKSCETCLRIVARIKDDNSKAVD
jgi:hypothetical protein